VSLGGYWPSHYSHVRYYWYGYHPYQWYGYHPVAYEVGGNNYNYYTYNYYGDNESDSVVSDGLPYGVTQTDLEDVRMRIAEQEAQDPAQMTLSDKYFENAVESFGKANYVLAAEYFSKAMVLSPDDMILPFAYSQALFADGQYREAAEVLREALSKVSPEKEGVFYPRGLYEDDETLFKQIEELTVKAGLYSFDADLQLLLGYHLLGIGELDDAVEPLRLAALDLENASSASVLLSLLEKIRLEQTEVERED
jgi:tetratricopeptide (TPR) repeat protein